jgi:predicted DNA-binding helix-hairpin-helix protein
MDVQRKLEILADAAKYDASCASSGTEQRDSSDGKGLGSTARRAWASAILTRRMAAASRC